MLHDHALFVLSRPDFNFVSFETVIPGHRIDVSLSRTCNDAELKSLER